MSWFLIPTIVVSTWFIIDALYDIRDELIKLNAKKG